MIDEQVRYRLPSEVIQAVAAAAALDRVHPSTIIERAVRMYLGPARVIEEAGSVISDNLLTLATLKDMIQVLADISVDKDTLIRELASGQRTID